MSDNRTAMVLSGGGAYGAYEVGVVKALMTGAAPSTDNAPLDARILCGTSVGAYSAAILAAQSGEPAEAAKRLEDLWLQRVADSILSCGNGVYRIRGGVPFEALDPGCYRHPLRTLLQFGQDAVTLGAVGLLQGARFLSSNSSLEARTMGLIDLEAFISESPLVALLAETIDLDTLRRSSKELFVATSSWTEGTARVFSRREITDVVGTDAILASTAIPGIFPPVEIDDSFFADGGVLMNTPLEPAIRSGASILHVIFADPLLDNMPLRPVPSTLDTAYRLFAVLAASQLRADVAKAARINRTLEFLDQSHAASTDRSEARAFLEFGRQVLERQLAGRSYRQLEIHLYRPRFQLAGGEGLLDFSQRHIETLIAQGYQGAVRHDCDREGCVIPGGAP